MNMPTSELMINVDNLCAQYHSDINLLLVGIYNSAYYVLASFKNYIMHLLVHKLNYKIDKLADILTNLSVYDRSVNKIRTNIDSKFYLSSFGNTNLKVLRYSYPYISSPVLITYPELFNDLALSGIQPVRVYTHIDSLHLDQFNIKGTLC